MKQSTKATLSLVSAAIIFASIGLYARYLNEYFSYSGQYLTRCALVFLIMSIYIAYKKVDIKVDRKTLQILIISGFFWSLSGFLLVVSLNESTFYQTISILYVGVVISSIISSFVLKEKINITQWFSIMLIIFALNLLIFSDEFILIPAILAFMAGVAEIITGIIRKTKTEVNQSCFLYYQFFGMLFGSSIFIILLNDKPYKQVTALSIILIILYIVSMFLLSILLLFGFQNTTLSNSGVLLTLEIPIVIIFGKIFFGENITLRMAVVAGIIMFASYLSQKNSAASSTSQDTPTTST